jgi:hypothetical protein
MLDMSTPALTCILKETNNPSAPLVNNRRIRSEMRPSGRAESIGDSRVTKVDVLRSRISGI